MLYTKSFEVMPADPTPSGDAEQRVGTYASKYRSPCEVFNCINQQRCKEQQLACKSFARFVNKAQYNGAPPKPPSEPSKAIFDKIYDDDEDFE